MSLAGFPLNISPSFRKILTHQPSALSLIGNWRNADISCQITEIKILQPVGFRPGSLLLLLPVLAACSCCSCSHITAPADRLQSPVTNHDVIPTAGFCWVTLLWASVMRVEQTDGWLIQLSCLQWEIGLLTAITTSLRARVCACVVESICHFFLQASSSTAWVCLWNFSSPEQMLLKTTCGTNPGSARIWQCFSGHRCCSI